MKFKLSIMLISILVIGGFAQAKNVNRFTHAKFFGSYSSDATGNYYNVDIKLIIDRKNKTIRMYYPEREYYYVQKKHEDYKDFYFILSEKGVSQLREALKKSLEYNIQYKNNEVKYVKNLSKIDIEFYWKTKNQKKWKHRKMILDVEFWSKLGERCNDKILPRNILFFSSGYTTIKGDPVGVSDIIILFPNVKKLIKYLNFK